MQVTACLLYKKHFNSHEWPRQNFSLQCQYNVKHASDENKEKYQLCDYQLILHQILWTNYIRSVKQTVWRITYQILWVKGLTWFSQSWNCKNYMAFSVDSWFLDLGSERFKAVSVVHNKLLDKFVWVFGFSYRVILHMLVFLKLPLDDTLTRWFRKAISELLIILQNLSLAQTLNNVIRSVYDSCGWAAGLSKFQETIRISII